MTGHPALSRSQTAIVPDPRCAQYGQGKARTVRTSRDGVVLLQRAHKQQCDREDDDEGERSNRRANTKAEFMSFLPRIPWPSDYPTVPMRKAPDGTRHARTTPGEDGHRIIAFHPCRHPPDRA